MPEPVLWPAGVPMKLQRSGYSRQPQDIVHRMKMDTGPALRRLVDGSAGQRVKGVLSLSAAQAALFETWRLETLDRGQNRFSWQIPDNGRSVTARLAAQPQLTRAGARWRYALDIECDAPAPSLAALEALAELEDEGPASWPGAVPFRPQRAGFSRVPEDGVLRTGEGGYQAQALGSRADGSVLSVVLHLSPAELAAFETWFETAAAFGARDILFPSLSGGTHLGHFHEVYAVTAATTADWAVSTKIYLEAIA